MRVHEYQAKELLSQYGIPVPWGRVAKEPAEVRQIVTELGGKAVIKAQLYAGGRGQAGGVKRVNSPEEAENLSARLLGSRLVTRQTGPEGAPVEAVLVEEVVESAEEFYLGVAIDSWKATPVVIASRFGGMEVEEIAASNPESIIRSYLDPRTLELYPFQAREIAFSLGLEPEQIRPAASIISSLCHLFVQKDCSLAEINPLSLTTNGRFLALDAKLTFDDNALYRHPEISSLHDPAQENALEMQASKEGIVNYVKLEGDIGIIVNGAGLAMAVMDALKNAGGRPANFLDIGTINRAERVVSAFKILSSDPNVKCVLVNIFGGMARVDVIANGLVQAFKEVNVKVPVVARLKGTNAAEGERILAQASLNLIRADTFREAIDKAVCAASVG